MIGSGVNRAIHCKHLRIIPLRSVRARNKYEQLAHGQRTAKKHTSKQFVQFAAPLINPITFDIDFEWLSLAGAAASTRSNHAGTIARTTEKPINRVRVRASFWHMSRQACRTCATGPISASVDSRCTPVECYRQADNRCHHLHANALPSLSRSLARSLFLLAVCVYLPTVRAGVSASTARAIIYLDSNNLSHLVVEGANSRIDACVYKRRHYSTRRSVLLGTKS